VQYATAYLDAHSDWNTFTNQSWILDPWTSWLRADPTRRVILGVPMLQVESAGDFSNTSYDQYFVRLAQTLKDRGIASQVIIRLGYEMNGDWMPWGRQHSMDGSGFRAMWRRVVPQMKAVHPLLFDWCIVPDDPALAGAGYGPNFYPGDDVVDIIGLDVYDSWVSGTPDQRWQQTVTKLDWAASFAGAHGKPMSLDEWGLWNASNSHGGGDNPTYITNMLRWAVDHELLWTSYFNSPEGSVENRLQDNPNGLNAFRQAMAGS
jgi:beta-mannanase